MCPEAHQVAVAGESFRTNCSLGYAGLWAPEITWRDAAGDVIPATNATSGDTANYWAEFFPTAEDHGLALTCSASMPAPPAGVLPDDDLTTVHSRNKPQYSQHLCQVTLDVWCKCLC